MKNKSNSTERKIYKNKGNDEVLKNIPEDATVVLDVECGAGDNASILNERGHIVDGITASPAEAKIASEYCRNVYIHNLENGIPEELKNVDYQCVICSHVIEHLKSPDRLSRDVKKVMKEGANLVVALPNILYCKNRLKILLGEFKYEESGLMDNTHYKFYTYETAQKIFEDEQLEKTKHYVTGGFPLSRIFPKKIQDIVDRISCKMLP